MRKILFGSLLVASAFAGAGAALASGGMGDPSEHTRQMNAICEMQRRGEGPSYPNLCLPELPVNAGERDHTHG